MAGGVSKIFLRTLVGLPIAVVALAPALAAPILGQDQEGQTTAAPSNPAVQPAVQSPVVSAQATVIEFTILPSAADPNVLETTVIVQQAGGRKVCVNHSSQDIVVRSYETEADPFIPDILAKVEGKESGHIGELSGFNSDKIFITPKSPNDRFNSPEEPFTVGSFEGVFVPEEAECDQELTEGDYVCIDEVIRTEDCALGDHADLERDLRLMLALNALPIIAPAAGGPLGQGTGQVFGADAPAVAGGGLPTGGVGAAPNFSGSFSGSGGEGLITVPTVIGLPLANAMSVITSAGLTVGTITASSGDNAGFFDGLIIATAYAQTFPENVDGASTVVGQTPSGGTSSPSGAAVSLVAQPNAIPVPEPSTLSIFLLGLLLAGGMFWYSRTRSRPVLRRA